MRRRNALFPNLVGDGASLSLSFKKRSKAQSAMEYLMTYGWAILIIAIVLSALFQLGVFSSGSITGNSCIASVGYLCQNPLLVTTGLLSFSFGQSTGVPFYNFQLACAATATSAGEPNPITAFNSISAAGIPLPASNTGNTLINGQTITVSSLPCYNVAAQPLGTLSIGSGFSGYIWVNYTSSPNPAAPGTNPFRTAKAIAIRTRVV